MKFALDTNVFVDAFRDCDVDRLHAGEGVGELRQPGLFQAGKALRPLLR